MSTKIDLNKLSRKDLIKRIVELERDTSYLSASNQDLSKQNAGLADEIDSLRNSNMLLSERVEHKHIAIIALQEKALARDKYVEALGKSIEARIKSAVVRGRIRSKYSKEYALIRDAILAGRTLSEDVLVEVSGLTELDPVKLMQIYEELTEKELSARDASNLNARLRSVKVKSQFEVKDVFALETK